MSLKTVQTRIKSNDRNFVGKKLVFDHLHTTTVGTIIAVTQDRVIYVDEQGKEEWSWIHPNGKDIGFSVLDDGKSDKEFIRAIKLEDAYLMLRKQYANLKDKYDEVKKYESVIKHIQQLSENIYD